MKKLKKAVTISLLIFILTVLANQAVFASNPANLLERVEYSEDFKKWLKLSDEEKKNVMIPRMYEVPNTKLEYKNPLYNAKMLRANINSRYSLKDIIPSNLVIKNQQQTNSCWTFAIMSSLETNLALSNYKKGINTPKVYDFSERHMEYATSRKFLNDVENPIGYNRNIGEGGTIFMANSYLANGTGAIPEAEMPFENNENVIDISQIQNKTVSSQLYDTIDFPGYGTKTDTEKTEIMNQIKQHIQNYGSVYAGLHGESASTSDFSCYNNETSAKFCDNTNEHKANHAVSIIGWDDNYSMDNFAQEAKPTSNGAWIVRNSWGKTYGDDGLIYVSYEDVNISKEMYGIVKATDTVDYENLYYYDELGYNGYMTVNSSNIMLCNIFNKKTTGTEYLNQILLYAPDTYTCKVYVNPNGTSKAKNDLQLISLKAGESETVNVGYHTLEFAKPIEIKANSFTVVVEIQSIRDETYFALEEKSSFEITNDPYLNTKIENGKCFFANGNNLENCKWYDLGKFSESELGILLPDGDSTIKAFTTSELIDESLKNIEIITPPTKTSYFEGENFDKTGMVVKANYNSKIKPYIILDSSSYNITNGNDLKAGQTSVTITYEDKSINQIISVEKNSITDLRIKTPPTKTVYKEGENFDKTGMIVEATYKDGTTKTITDYTIKNGNNLKSYQTVVTISYGEKTVQQVITVTPNPLMGIKVTKAPNKTKYIVGQNFDKTGMIITGTYQDKSTHEIIDYIVENGENLLQEQTAVIIKYENKTTTQEITVEEKAINSNLDNAKIDIKRVQAYYYTDNFQKDYTLINVEVHNILRNLTNDAVEYYYCLSTNANEQNINDWTKITEIQNSENKIQFTIDSRKVLNYNEIASEKVIYLYIKEVAKKGGNQSIEISKSIKLETDINIETYVNDIKKEDIKTDQLDSSNSNQNITIPKELPHAGIKTISIILISIIIVVSIILYIKYKKLGKYTDG